MIHDLTDEMPTSVQIAVSKRSHTSVIAYPPVIVCRFGEATFELGLTSFEAGPGEPVRIYDAARTVVDLMRFRKRLGEAGAGLPSRFSDTVAAVAAFVDPVLGGLKAEAVWNPAERGWSPEAPLTASGSTESRTDGPHL